MYNISNIDPISNINLFINLHLASDSFGSALQSTSLGPNRRRLLCHFVAQRQAAEGGRRGLRREKPVDLAPRFMPIVHKNENGEALG